MQAVGSIIILLPSTMSTIGQKLKNPLTRNSHLSWCRGQLSHLGALPYFRHSITQEITRVHLLLWTHLSNQCYLKTVGRAHTTSVQVWIDASSSARAYLSCFRRRQDTCFWVGYLKVREELEDCRMVWAS
jgi:hypothetical protein